MNFLRLYNVDGIIPVIQGKGVTLRTPVPRDYEAWSRLRAASRAFLTPWEPIWPSNDLTRSGWRSRLRRYSIDMRADAAYPVLVFRSDDGVLVGGLTLGNIRRGVSQSASLGYWMGEPYAGKGYMSAAVRAILPFAFQRLHLHRIEAACLPHNEASMRLLERVGFQREGYARRYLRIAGEWQDHVLYAILADDPPAG